MDMAVGIIIGTAFGKIITSLVNDVLMPPLGLLLGKLDFSNFVITLHQATANAPAVTLRYGVFINNVIDFVIVAFAMFLVIRQINRFIKKPAATTKDCTYCYSKIAIKATRCPNCTSELKACQQ
jgi:large conductance mechanosensitive channel